MATHSSVLAWRIPGTGESGGLPSLGSHRVGHDWSNLAAAIGKPPKWTEHQDWLSILRLVLHRKADHFSESLYHHAWNPSEHEDHAWDNKPHPWPAYLAPSPCAFPPMLFHSMEFRKFCFLCLGGSFSTSIFPSSNSYFFFITLLRPPLLQEAFPFSQIGLGVISQHYLPF